MTRYFIFTGNTKPIIEGKCGISFYYRNRELSSMEACRVRYNNTIPGIIVTRQLSRLPGNTFLILSMYVCMYS